MVGWIDGWIERWGAGWIDNVSETSTAISPSIRMSCPFSRTESLTTTRFGWFFPSSFHGLFLLSTPPSMPPARRYCRGPDDVMPQDVDWGDSDDLLGNAQDMGAFYAQVGWEPGAAAGGGGTIAVAGGGGGGGRRGVPQVFQQAGGGGDGSEAWVARGATAAEQLSMWGVQPPPGLARQYATRHGDRTGGMVRTRKKKKREARRGGEWLRLAKG